MNRSDAHVLILGGGATPGGGGTAAALLRQYGFEGAVTLIGEELIAPYHRPPLSKVWLRNGPGAASLLSTPVELYAGHGIDIRPRVRAERSGQRLAVIGGGYIGVEVAASARALGAEVVVIERETRLLARVAVFHLRGDQVQCVEALNSPQDFIFGKQLIASRKSVDLGKLGDPAIALKEIAEIAA